MTAQHNGRPNEAEFLKRQFNAACKEANELGYSVAWNVDPTEGLVAKATVRLRLIPQTPKAAQAIKVAGQSSQITAIEAGMTVDSKGEALSASVQLIETALEQARQAA